MRIFIALFVLLGLMGTGQSDKPQLSAEDTAALLARAEGFLDAVADANLDRAWEYTVFSKPDDVDKDFFSEGDYMLSDTRTMRAISQDGPLVILPVPQSPDEAIVLFMTPEFAANIPSDDGLHEAWMREYFACRFAKRGGTWVIIMNFCFAETGGPYHPPYG